MFRGLAARLALSLQANAEINEMTRDHEMEARVAPAFMPGLSSVVLLTRRRSSTATRMLG